MSATREPQYIQRYRCLTRSDVSCWTRCRVPPTTGARYRPVTRAGTTVYGRNREWFEVAQRDDQPGTPWSAVMETDYTAP